MVFPSGTESPRPALRAIDLALEADSLVILYAPDQTLERRRYLLQPAITTIGRSKDNDIVLDHESVSRRHARLERRADGLWLKGESSNGTLVSGKPVREQRLRLHDRIGVGEFLLVLSATHIPYEMR
jgi:pSer/pThr/pTyr-binding forkhead associated (FHA) protein